jgi:Rrf2 family protein
MVCLASESPAARTTQQIAEVTKVPAAYLAKVIQSLNRAGLVHSQRGIGGGVSLMRAPNQISILEVVNAVDPIPRIQSCPLGLESHGVNLCPLHRRVDNAMAMVEKAFRSTTLAEVIAEPTDSVPLCEFPRKP